MLLRGTVLDQDNMVIDAAVDGQGAALARTALAVPCAYWIVCSRAAAALPKAVTFRDWPLAGAEQDLDGPRRLIQ